MTHTNLGRAELRDRVNLEVRHGRQVRRARRGTGGIDADGRTAGRGDALDAYEDERRRRSRSPRARASSAGPFARIEDAIEAFRAGKIIIVVDDEERENEGDLTIAAEKVTPEAINFLARYGRGLICLSMTAERLDELQIPLLVRDNTSRFETAFCTPIDVDRPHDDGHFRVRPGGDRAGGHRSGVAPGDFARPGHIQPLRAQPGGVLVRAGQTEAAVDLARIAGLYPAGVICEIMNEDGTMARVPELTKFAKKHGLLMITIADLIKHRMRTESLVRRVANAKLPTEFGVFRVHAFENQIDRHDARRARLRRDRERQGHSRPRALAVSDGRRVPFRALRLRCAARSRDGAHRRRRTRDPVCI